MKINKKQIAAIVTALLGILGALKLFLDEPTAELPDVEVSVVPADAGV